MGKDFAAWNSLKEKIHEFVRRPFFREGEVWWCSLGLNIGFEVDGKNDIFERPVFILKKFNNETCWALPTTSQQKSGRFYYAYVHAGGMYAISLSQVRLIDAKRLTRRAYVLSQKQHAEITNRFLALLT